VDLALVVTVVVVALAFDYTNGFHDAANAIATSVSTRALTPRLALTLAAVMNFVGALLGQEVAHTVSDTIGVPSGNHGLVVVLAALLGAITWNLITWYFGLPSSSSHALIGGLGGAALAAGAVVHWQTILDKVVIPMVISPVVGFVAAFLVMLSIMLYASCIARSSGTHRTILSSSESLPRSRSCMIEIAVRLFVIDPQWKIVCESTRTFADRSAKPTS